MQADESLKDRMRIDYICNSLGKIPLYGLTITEDIQTNYVSQDKEIFKFQRFEYKKAQVKPKKVKFINKDDDSNSVSSKSEELNETVGKKFDENTGRYIVQQVSESRKSDMTKGTASKETKKFGIKIEEITADVASPTIPDSKNFDLNANLDKDLIQKSRSSISSNGKSLNKSIDEKQMTFGADSPQLSKITVKKLEEEKEKSTEKEKGTKTPRSNKTPMKQSPRSPSHSNKSGLGFKGTDMSSPERE